MYGLVSWKLFVSFNTLIVKGGNSFIICVFFKEKRTDCLVCFNEFNQPFILEKYALKQRTTISPNNGSH